MDIGVINQQNGSGDLLNGSLDSPGFWGSKLGVVNPIVFLCLRLLVGCVSFIGSFCVMVALWRIKQRVLKPRLLLINAMTTDILFSITMGFVGCVNTLEPLGIIGINDFPCLRYIANFLTPAIQYAQVISCLVLTLDRIYAVVAPFQYHSNAYPPLLTAAILSFLWACVVCLMVPVFWVSGEYARWKGPCSQMRIGHTSWTMKIRFPLVVGVSVLNFVIFSCLFLFVRCRRVMKKGQTHSLFSKQSISLAFTFFGIQLSVMLLYLPGPLYDVLLKAAKIRLDHVVKKRVRYVFILLFTCIPLLNFTLLAVRIPNIKAELMNMLGRQTSNVSGKKKDIISNGQTPGNKTESGDKETGTSSGVKTSTTTSTTTTPIEAENGQARGNKTEIGGMGTGTSPHVQTITAPFQIENEQTLGIKTQTDGLETRTSPDLQTASPIQAENGQALGNKTERGELETRTPSDVQSTTSIQTENGQALGNKTERGELETRTPSDVQSTTSIQTENGQTLGIKTQTGGLQTRTSQDLQTASPIQAENGQARGNKTETGGLETRIPPDVQPITENQAENGQTRGNKRETGGLGTGTFTAVQTTAAPIQTDEK